MQYPRSLFTCLVVVAATGCGGGHAGTTTDSSVAIDSQHAAIDAPHATIDAAPGAKDAAIIGDASVHTGSRPAVVGGSRPTTVQTPAHIVAGQTYPLILILHGYGLDGAEQQTYMQMDPPPITGGAFVLAPDGTADETGEKFWNAGPECCDLYHSGVNDVAYLGGIVEDTIAGWPVDPSRVYIVGHSNGAFMAYRMACERADIFTGIAILAGANISLDGTGCTASQPVSILHMHGTADTVVAYAGDTSVAPGEADFPGAVESVTQWAGYDGCSATLTNGTPFDMVVDLLGAETTPMVAGCSNAAHGVGVELWSIEDAEHIPTLQPTFGSDVTTWLMAHPRT